MVDQASATESEYSDYRPEDVDAMRKLLDTVTSREKVIKTEWLDDTKDIFSIYEGGKAKETPFNILYSNTEVLVPNLFASVPKPVVRRRFGENRADEAATAAERMAEYSMDTNLAGYPTFVDAIESAVLAAALPGQGQARLRVQDGLALIDYVQHDQFIWAYAKRWEDTGWLAYRHELVHSDIVSQFKLSPDAAKLLAQPSEESSATKDKGPSTIPVYEVWNKKTRKVYFMCGEYQHFCLREDEDPLQLAGFFPSGKPLRLISTPVSTMPAAMYNLYRQQAEELNAVTTRIKRVAQAIQIKGLYDGNLPEVANLFDTANAENTLTPASNPSGMARDGGLDRYIWLVPVEKYVVVLQQLYQIREQIKSTIYEILGIGDILRGVSAASETASAQQIKDKWGSLRIKKSRERVSEFVRFQVRGLIELAAKHTPEEIWAEVTGLSYATQRDVAIAQASNAPPPDHTWESVLSALRSDTTRSYIIDIETNSTVDADATDDKQEIVDFMNAMGQAMPTLQGLASQGPEGHKAATTLLVEICKRFQMGGELQRLLMSMQPQNEASPEVAEARKAVDAEKKALEQQKAQLEQQRVQLEQQQTSVRQQTQSAEDALRRQAQANEDASRNLQAQLFELEMLKKELALQQKELAFAQKTLTQPRSAPSTKPTR